MIVSLLKPAAVMYVFIDDYFRTTAAPLALAIGGNQWLACAA